MFVIRVSTSDTSDDEERGTHVAEGVGEGASSELERADLAQEPHVGHLHGLDRDVRQTDRHRESDTSARAMV